VLSTSKGEYYSFLRKIEGRATKDILAEALPGVIPKIYFPKTMYWTGRNGPRFIRPIRWIVAMLGHEIVPFEIAGVKSGRVTAGHRRLGSPSIAVNAPDYELQLRANFVILSTIPFGSSMTSIASATNVSCRICSRVRIKIRRIFTPRRAAA